MPEDKAAEGRQARRRWNTRYRQTTGDAKPARVITENQHLLPSAGRALDLACGLGGNARFLAEHGLDTWAWDVSEVAVTQVQRMSQQCGLSLQAEGRDVSLHPPTPNSFDVIVVSRFLDRDLAPALIEALAPDGLLFYQTFTRDALAVVGPKNPAFLLEVQELLSLFRPLRVLCYREEGQVGDMSRGLRYEAMLVGQKVVS
jgi:SAM-dependent methyltransferase